MHQMIRFRLLLNVMSCEMVHAHSGVEVEVV